MSREEIIRMAREAGFADSNGVVHAFYQLEYFAYLVAEHEREVIWNLLFEYAGRDDLSDSDQSLLKHLLNLIAARWQEWSNKEGEEHMSKEAMQMALEALESDPISHVGLVSRKQAITALRQALEADGGNCYGDGTVYRGQRSKDSAVTTYTAKLKEKNHG